MNQRQRYLIAIEIVETGNKGSRKRLEPKKKEGSLTMLWATGLLSPEEWYD
jgi:hypothetical protein